METFFPTYIFHMQDNISLVFIFNFPQKNTFVSGRFFKKKIKLRNNNFIF